MDAPYDQGLKRFAQLVEERTDGALRIEVYANAEIGGESDLIQSMQAGTVDLGVVGAGPVSEYVPAGGVMNLPFLITNRGQRMRVLDSGLLEGVERQVERSVDVRTLSYFGGGGRHLFCTDPVTSMEEARGRIMRVQPSPFMSEAWGALGMTPATISYEEMYNALQQGVASAADNETVLILTQNFFEAAPHLLLTQHETAIRPFMVSNVTLERLSRHHREVVVETAAEVAEYEYEVETEADEDSLRVLQEEHGVRARDVDIEASIRTVEPIWRRYASVWEMEEEVQSIIEMRE